MVGPRKLFVELTTFPEITLPSEGGAPAVVKYTNRESMNSTNNEFNRLAPFSRGWNRRVPTWLTFIAGNPERAGVPISGWRYMPSHKPIAPAGKAPESLCSIDGPARQEHQIDEIIR